MTKSGRRVAPGVAVALIRVADMYCAALRCALCAYCRYIAREPAVSPDAAAAAAAAVDEASALTLRADLYMWLNFVTTAFCGVRVHLSDVSVFGPCCTHACMHACLFACLPACRDTCPSVPVRACGAVCSLASTASKISSRRSSNSPVPP